MSTTKNGIYYPNDYESVADIPADMKKLAESVDTKISENKTEIENIKKEQITQNTNISSLEKDNTTNKQDITEIKEKDTEQDKYIAELEAENARLREDLNGLPKGQASGEGIDLNDSAEMRCELKISGNSKQEKREGYNVLDVTRLTDTAKTQDIQVDDEFYVSDSTSTTDSRAWNYTYCNWNNINLKSGTYTIVLLFQKQCTNNGGYMGIYDEYDNAISSELSNHITGVSKHIRTIKISQDQKIGIEVKGFDGIYRIMLLEGEYAEETLPDFEPYGASPSPDYPSEVESCGDSGYINEVICNKNLWKCNYDEVTSEEIWLHFKLKPNTEYTMSTNLKNNYNGSNGLSWIFIMSGFVNSGASSDTNGVWENQNRTVTSDSEGYISVAIRQGVEVLKVDFNDYEIQLEEGSIATEYAPHYSQIFTIPTQQPMRAIGDIRDTFIKKNNKWFERHYIARYIFTGNETISINAVNDTVNRFSITLSNINNSLDNANNIITKSNHFLGISHNDRNNVDNSVFSTCNGTSHTLNINTSKYSTANDFKVWLTAQYNAGTPVYVDYIAETPIDIECTEEQSTILFDIEQNAKTYDKVTHMYSTDEVSPNVEVTYKKDIETLFNTLVESGV